MFLDAERRPREPEARRDVVRVGVDRLQELQVVAQARVQRQVGGWLSTRPARRCRRSALVCDTTLSPKVCVKPALLYVPVEEVRERRERVRAANRPRIGDRVVVVEKVDADPQRVRTRLMREVVRRPGTSCSRRPVGTARQRAERRHAGDAHRRTDRIAWAAPSGRRRRTARAFR